MYIAYKFRHMSNRLEIVSSLAFNIRFDVVLPSNRVIYKKSTLNSNQDPFVRNKDQLVIITRQLQDSNYGEERYPEKIHNKH